MNFQMFKLDLEKAEEPEIKLPSVFWNIEKAREFQKNIYFALLTTPKPLSVWITTNCGKLLRRWQYKTTVSASCHTCASQEATATSGMEQQTDQVHHVKGQAG